PLGKIEGQGGRIGATSSRAVSTHGRSASSVSSGGGALGHGPLDALDAGGRDAGSLGYLPDRQTLAERLLDFSANFQREVGTAEGDAARSGTGEARVDPARDDGALELAEDRQHLEEHATRGR